LINAYIAQKASAHHTVVVSVTTKSIATALIEFVPKGPSTVWRIILELIGVSTPIVNPNETFPFVHVTLGVPVGIVPAGHVCLQLPAKFWHDVVSTKALLLITLQRGGAVASGRQNIQN
jgi:hypothetical protein